MTIPISRKEWQSTLSERIAPLSYQASSILNVDEGTGIFEKSIVGFEAKMIAFIAVG